MKLCARHKAFVAILAVLLILIALLILMEYESILTTYSEVNGVKSVVYTPINEAIPKLFLMICISFTLWEIASRRNDKKISEEPELQSYRIRGSIINGYFFLISLVAPLACILTLFNV